MQRGVIRNRNYVQIHDFSGLRFKNITPTDIDGFIDFGNKLFIFIEFKYKETKLPYGQRVALERIAKAIIDIPTIVIVAEHNTPPREDINTAMAIVREYYLKKWHVPKRETTVLEAITITLKFFKINEE